MQSKRFLQIYNSAEAYEAFKEKYLDAHGIYWRYGPCKKKKAVVILSLYLMNYLGEPLLLTRMNRKKFIVFRMFALTGVIWWYMNLAKQLIFVNYGRMFHLDGKFKSMPEFKRGRKFSYRRRQSSYVAFVPMG
jgi:hypothetical protein